MLPSYLGNMQQPMHPIQIDKGTVFDHIDDGTGHNGTLFQGFQPFLTLLNHSGRF